MSNDILKHLPGMSKHFGKDLAFLAVIGLSAIAALVFTQNGLWIILALVILVGAWGFKKAFGWLD